MQAFLDVEEGVVPVDPSAVAGLTGGSTVTVQVPVPDAVATAVSQGEPVAVTGPDSGTEQAVIPPAALNAAQDRPAPAGSDLAAATAVVASAGEAPVAAHDPDAMATQDLDTVVRRTDENLSRAAAALEDLGAVLLHPDGTTSTFPRPFTKGLFTTPFLGGTITTMTDRGQLDLAFAIHAFAGLRRRHRPVGPERARGQHRDRGRPRRRREVEGGREQAQGPRGHRTPARALRARAANLTRLQAPRRTTL